MIIIAKRGQSVLDIAIQYYGTADRANEICKINNITIDSNIDNMALEMPAGMTTIDTEPCTGVSIEDDNLVYNTIGLAVVGTMIIL